MIGLPTGQMLLRLLVAMLLGVAVGAEREQRARPAGMRTLALVSMGSALFMILSAYGFSGLSGGEGARVDPSRIAAQIVTGIGFLGAGTILLHRHIVQGLTTAAAIWVVAAIGMACGVGLLLDAAGATALCLVVLLVLRPVEGYLFHHREVRHRILLSTSPDTGAEILQGIAQTFQDVAVEMEAVELRKGPQGQNVELRTGPVSQADLLHLAHQLEQLPGVLVVRADLRTGGEPVRRPHYS
jgi:putative Mg2+ transporter-C (MgtC) family protein